MLEKEIAAKLAEFEALGLPQGVFAGKALKRVQVTDKQIDIDLLLGFPCQDVVAELANAVKDCLAPLAAGKSIQVTVASQIDAHAGKHGVQGLANIKNIIAVASGKGGVGKSTVAVNLALSLARAGAQVGLLDADIYGPSQPTMLGSVGQRPALVDSKLQPIVRHGIQSMSIGYLVDQHAPMVWRGPMIGKAMEQMLNDTSWQALDYLVVDLPPGTGDIQLTLCQKMPVSGALIVTTPQDLALIDVTRACEMFTKMNVPILGIVENMSVYHCTQCGHAESIFGQGGAEKLAKQYGVSVLGTIPLDIHIREMTDNGHPPVVQEPNSHYAKAFSQTALRTAERLSRQTKDYSAKFPKIVVEQPKGE